MFPAAAQPTARTCRPPSRRPAVRRGLTLVELLVVITIVVMLAAALSPMIGAAMRDREIRESARMVNTFFAAAQAQAVAENRVVGVWLQPAANDPTACHTLYMAEEPPAYSGDVLGARAGITVISSGNPWVCRAQLTAAGSLARLEVLPNDTIRFNYQGLYYPITQVGSGYVDFTRPPTVPTAMPPLSGNAGVPYQIYRKPRRSGLRSIELPTPAVVDLVHSGVGIDSLYPMFRFPSSNAPLIITFLPDGSLGNVYWSGVPQRPNAPVHLLIGRADQVETDANVADQHALWISVGSSNGAITTAANFGTANLVDARKLAQAAQSEGGK